MLGRKSRVEDFEHPLDLYFLFLWHAKYFYITYVSGFIAL